MKKLRLMFRWTFVFVLLGMLHVHANVYPQNGQQVTLSMKAASLKDVLWAIERQTSFVFMYNEEDLDRIGKVDVDVKGDDIRTILNVCLNGTDLIYVLQDNVIVLKPTVPQKTIKEVLLKGKVVDEKKEPLPGVTILVKGTSVGAVTDANGQFAMRVPETANLALVFSFIGMEPKEVAYKGQQEFYVVMKTAKEELEEVVVTGYMKLKKESFTGNTTTVNKDQLLKTNNKNVIAALQAFEPSFRIKDNKLFGSDPNSLPEFTIRGEGSIGMNRGLEMEKARRSQRTSLKDNPNLPIFIMDGFEVSVQKVYDMDINRIESMTILKDAAATAIYGARAANGVIVVETKSGLSGKTRFNASVNVGITERPRNNIDMMNTAEKIQFEREIFYDQQGYIYTPGRVTKLLQQAAYGEISSDEAERRIGELAKINTDWFKEIYRTAISQQYNFSMSGGNEKTQHYVSLNYLKEVGTEPNNKYDRLGMNIKLTHNPSEKIRITGGLGATMKNDRVTASSVNSLEYAMYANPYERLKNEDGTKAYDISYNAKESSIRDGLDWDTFNILDDLNRNTNTNRYLDAELSLKVEWEIVKGLMFTTHGVYNANSNHNRIIEGADTYTNFINNWYSYKGEIPHDMVKGSLREATGYTNAYTFRNTLQYTGEYAGKHYISLFAGQEIQERTAYNSFNYSPVFDEEHRIVGFPEMDGIDGSEINYNALGGTGKSVSKMSSFFANASYSYLDKYILTGALRYDGSDIIGNDNQFTPLWNVGLRLNLHREEFMKRWMWVDQFAVRGGFGYTGSIDKNALPFVVMTLGQSVVYDGQTVPTSFSYPNPNVKWQTKQDMNVGLDLSLFDYRLELGVNYYNNITRDGLDRKALPYSSGRSEVTENVADIYNSGWEIDLGVTLLKNKSFQWYAKANIAINDNKVKNTYYKETKDLPKATLSNAHQFVENQPVNGWYGYKFAGINPINGAVMTYTGNGEATLDMSVSGATWPTPSVFYLGNLTPPVVGGFSTSANWKQLIFSANFEFKTGHKIKSFNTFRSLDARNRHTSEANRWREPGDITNVPAMSEAFTTYSSYMYDILLEKGNYLRCSYMTLGYNLKPEWLHKIGFSTARLSFTAKNLFTISSYSGIDPALMGSFGYPNSRKYTITLNVGF